MTPHFSLWAYGLCVHHELGLTPAESYSAALGQLASAGATIPDEVDMDAPLFAYDLWDDHEVAE